MSRSCAASSRRRRTSSSGSGESSSRPSGPERSFASCSGRLRTTMSSTPVSKLAADTSLRGTLGAPLHLADDAAMPAAEPYAELVRQQLALLGEDPEREGLVRTPGRVAKAMGFLTEGYAMSLEGVV